MKGDEGVVTEVDEELGFAGVELSPVGGCDVTSPASLLTILSPLSLQFVIIRSACSILQLFLGLSIHPAEARSRYSYDGAHTLWDIDFWQRDVQAKKPKARDDFRKEHEDCVDNASPDDFTAEHVSDWNGEAN